VSSGWHQPGGQRSPAGGGIGRGPGSLGLFGLGAGHGSARVSGREDVGEHAPGRPGPLPGVSASGLRTVPGSGSGVWPLPPRVLPWMAGTSPHLRNASESARYLRKHSAEIPVIGDAQSPHLRTCCGDEPPVAEISYRLLSRSPHLFSLLNAMFAEMRRCGDGSRPPRRDVRATRPPHLGISATRQNRPASWADSLPRSSKSTGVNLGISAPCRDAGSFAEIDQPDRNDLGTPVCPAQRHLCRDCRDAEMIPAPRVETRGEATTAHGAGAGRLARGG
jgi:hypothetical protein